MAKRKSKPSKPADEFSAFDAPATGQGVVVPAPSEPVRGRWSLHRDPRVYGAACVKPPKTCRVVGLDLATNCGVAWCDVPHGQVDDKAEIVLSQWDLSTGALETGAARLLRLHQFLEMVQPSLILVEDVKYTPAAGAMSKFTVAAAVARAASAAELIGAFKWSVATWAEHHHVPMHGISIGMLKKFATGIGNASKADMIAACNREFGTSLPVEGYQSTGVDNMADAAFLCAIGVSSYWETLKRGSATFLFVDRIPAGHPTADVHGASDDAEARPADRADAG